MAYDASKECGPNGCYQHPPGLTTTHPLDERGHVMATADSTVTYKDIPDFPGYRVGDDGSVWSCRLLNGRGFSTVWRRLKLQLSKGYYRAALKEQRRNRWFPVHRLVLMVFVGPCPEGMEGCHNDGDRANNNLPNLRWDTPKSNTHDNRLNGTMPEGRRHGSANLTEEDIPRIRDLVAGGMSRTAVAEKFGVARSTLYGILSGRNWDHVP